MRIKLAILEKDQNYLNRITSVFNTKYSDKFEIYSFTDLAVAMETLEKAKIDVLLASESFEVDFDAIPKRCGFAYFVDSAGIETLKDQYAICKFQKVELIYKQILSIYSENTETVAGIKNDDCSTKLFAFTSPSGGVGTSSVAAACALHYAAKGKKTLYLNLEKFGSADAFFAAAGQFDMSDIIFSLKSRKANLALKLESCVKHDPRGVYFYSQPKLALDMLELTAEETARLVNELKVTGSYDYIIVDLDFSMEKEILDMLRMMHAVVMVSDGSEIANIKLYRAYQALRLKEQKAEMPITDRMCSIYNKFSNKTSKVLDNLELKNVGGAPRYEYATTEQVITELAEMEMFNKII